MNCGESIPRSRTSDFTDEFSPNSQNSTVGAGIRFWNGLCGVQIPPRIRYFLIYKSVETEPGAHSASYTGVFSLGVKRPGREVDRSPPPTAEVKNKWSYTPTLLPLYAFTTWTWNNFTFFPHPPHIIFYTRLTLRHCGGRKIQKLVNRPKENGNNLLFLFRVSKNTNSTALCFSDRHISSLKQKTRHTPTLS